MNSKAGTLLVSSSSLDDVNFERAVILITEHNEKGAMGFVVNKSFPRALNELVEFKHCKAAKLYDGGPVDREHLFFIHCRPDLIEGGIPLFDTVYLGGNFKQALAHINQATIPERDIRIFVGYCGWDYNQLEEEMAEGSWLVADAGIESVFSDVILKQ